MTRPDGTLAWDEWIVPALMLAPIEPHDTDVEAEAGAVRPVIAEPIPLGANPCAAEIP